MVWYKYRNKQTGEEVELSRPIADRDRGPDDILVTDPGAVWERPLVAPAFTSSSYLDGQKRPRSEGFDAIKTAAKLKVARAETMDQKEKARIDKEISRVERGK